MSGVSDKQSSGKESDGLFGIPDTGVSVAWDFSAGCASSENDKKGTHLKPATPKPSKFSSSKIYRRRCLSNQIKIPADVDDAFTAQLLSLVSVNRKNIIKNSPGVSPKGRSPRTLRSKVGKPSPRPDDNFMFLLDDSMENDDMIRCSQITEAALKDAEMKSPIVAKPEGRVGSARSRTSSRTFASPLARKKLIDSIVTPLAQSSNKPSSASSPAVQPKTDSDSVKSTDQCNNNVGMFGMGEDDDILMNAVYNCSTFQPIELPKRSPRLSLNQRKQTSITGVTPIVRNDNTNVNKLTVPATVKETPKTEPDKCIGAKKNDALTSAVLDDDMYFDLELSPHILNLLDGNVNQDKKQSTPKPSDTTCPTKGTVSKQTLPPNPPQPSLSTNKTDTSAQLKYKLNLVPSGNLKATSTANLSQTVQPVVKKDLPSKGLVRHASAPLSSSTYQLNVKPNPPPAQSKEPPRKCTREEIERKRQEALRKLKLSKKEPQGIIKKK